MTEAVPAASERIDRRDMPWPARPWVMALIGALSGWALWQTVDASNSANSFRQFAALATFIAVSSVSYLMTVELRRHLWALAFALGWGMVVGGVGYMSTGYSPGQELVEWPFLSSIFAVLLAAPLFQTARDEGGWRFPPMAVQMHAWTDAVIGATSLLFVGISFALLALIGGLFHLIGIDLIIDLFEKGWFVMLMAGAAFGGAVGLLRERDALVATMQRLVRIILAVLAPVLAFALVMFLLSLPLTGLAGLWDGWVSAAALTLLAAAGCFILLNAAIGPKDGEAGEGSEGKPTHPVLLWSALVLALVVLPLAVLADTALWLRIGQYGWTPERIWGLLCALIATTYGVAGWWAVIRQRLHFSPLLRTLETRLAIAVCGLALLLSLPIVDFGAISARDQLARLQSGRVKASEFDWAAMAFDFGPTGRAALRQLARSGPADQRSLAREALNADSRYALTMPQPDQASGDKVREALVMRPAGRILPDSAILAIARMNLCNAGTCVAQWIDDKRFVVLSRQRDGNQPVAILFSPDRVGDGWSTTYLTSSLAHVSGDLEQADIATRPVTRRQIYVNGQPVGDVIE